MVARDGGTGRFHKAGLPFSIDPRVEVSFSFNTGGVEVWDIIFDGAWGV